MIEQQIQPQLTIPRVIGCLSFFNADNLEIMRGFKDNEFDLAIVDPPYGLERFKKANEETTGVYAKRGSWKHKGDKNWNNEKPIDEYWEQLFRVSKNQIIWGANNFYLPISEYFLIWNKKQTVDNFSSAEYAWVSMGLKKPAKVFDYGIHKHNHTDKIHPTQKPIDLYRFILDTYTKENDKILDTHLGSGSIAIACHDYGFELTACELDKEYYDKAIQRITNHTNQQKLF